MRKTAKTGCAGISMIRAIIVFVALTPDMILGSGSATSPPPEQGTNVEQLQSPHVVQARQHPAYQVFAHHAQLPSITVVEKGTLLVGEEVKVDISRWDQLPGHQKRTLADQFDVPVSVVDKFLERFANNAQPNMERLGQELRTQVIDYKYLQEKWARYIPPAGKEKSKADAFQALQDGDIDKAWETYLALPRPGPPDGLRIVKDN